MKFTTTLAAVVALGVAPLASAQDAPPVGAAPAKFVGADLLPPSANPGECYARVFVPATFRTDSYDVLKREASTKIEVIPARYEWATEQVLVQEASERLEVVPAQYEWRTEEVLVKPASKQIVEVPAVYEWTEERVLDQPAHTVWKEGRGPIERVSNTTGEILCLVEVPATYKVVRKRVLKSAATTREIAIPEEYKSVRKRVMTQGPTTRKIDIPAKYETVRVRRLVEPENSRTIEIPAQYQTVTRTAKVSEGQMAWREILCETNVSPGIVRDIQRALQAAGHAPGPIDGQLGGQTMTAVSAFQRSKGLPTGNLTIATVEALGVKVR